MSAQGPAAPAGVREILTDLWHLAGGEAQSLAAVTLTGAEPALPSSFRVGAAAQATIAAAGLAAAEIRRRASGRAQQVLVDMRHAAVEFRSERYLEVEGFNEQLWDKIAGVYRTGDGRWVRLHTNFPHHRDGILALLGCDYERASVQAALMRWQGEPFETAAAERGLVATMMRSAVEWAAHPHGRAIAQIPVFDIARIGDAPPRPLPRGERPLSGLRVLDLTRVIAGPVAGRTLAAHGANVLLVTAAHLPQMPLLVRDCGRGKLATFIDLRQAEGRATLAALTREANVFIQGYRPGAIAGHGFAPEQLAALSPGIVAVSLSAYGHAGPWAQRRGFDSLVQTATGINHAEAAAAGVTGPKELPCQALDHASGYLMAFGAMMALIRQAREGGSWHVRVSLAQTGHWLSGLGRLDGGLAAADPGRADIADLLEISQSGFGRMSAVRHAAVLSETPARWSLPAAPLGTHQPRWPDRDDA